MFERLRRLFSSKKPSSINMTEEDSRDGETVDIEDIFGRNIQMTRKTYRSDFLPVNVKEKWDLPNDLYNFIVIALKDGFFVEIEQAAKHLIDIDPNHARSFCLYGIVLMKLNNYRDAEKVFLSYLKQYPKNGYILTNLSKVQHALGKQEESVTTLEEGLRIDPNQENGLDLWIANRTESLGFDTNVYNLAILEEANKNFGGWRIKVLIGSYYADHKQREVALNWFQNALADNWGVDALTLISGALGKNGFVEEVINLIVPLYIPQQHDILTGTNLLQGYLELKRPDEGIKLLDVLISLHRPNAKQRSDEGKELSDRLFIVSDMPDMKRRLLWYQREFGKLKGFGCLASNDGWDIYLRCQVRTKDNIS